MSERWRAGSIVVVWKEGTAYPPWLRSQVYRPWRDRPATECLIEIALFIGQRNMALKISAGIDPPRPRFYSLSWLRISED